MKRQVNLHPFLNLLILLTLITCYSCGQGNTGNIETQTNRNEYRITDPVSESQRDWSKEEIQFDSLPLDTHNAVKIDAVKGEHFDWTTLRNHLHMESEGQEENIRPKIDSENIATGPWISRGEYNYQLVYRLVNDELWLHTMIQESGPQPETYNQILLLDRELADELKMASLWTDMEQRGISLGDSLRNK